MAKEAPNALESALEFFTSPQGGPVPLEVFQHGRILAHHIQHLSGLSDKLDAANVRRVQAERAKQTLESRLRELEAQARDVPRTIVLAWMPRQDTGEMFDAEADYGGHWTVSEAGRAQDRLDAGEALGLVAAMLLGASHPPLKSFTDVERRARGKASHRIERLPAPVTPRPLKPVTELTGDELVEWVGLDGEPPRWHMRHRVHWASLGYSFEEQNAAMREGLHEARRRNENTASDGDVVDAEWPFKEV